MKLSFLTSTNNQENTVSLEGKFGWTTFLEIYLMLAKSHKANDALYFN